MEEVKALIKSALPTVTDEILQNITAFLEEFGVRELRHLDLLEEEDLTKVMNTIDARLLLREWRKHKKAAESIKENSSIDISSMMAVPSTSATFLENLKPSTSKRSVFNPQKYEVPWDSMPEELLRYLKEKLRPPPSLRSQMVRIISEDIHKLIEKPGRKALDVVASKIVDKYPQSFADDIGITLSGISHLSLSKQFEIRFDNINRSSPVNVLKRKSKHGDKCTKKIKLSDTYGCINYQPDMPLTESNQSQLEKKEKMKTLVSSDEDTLSEEYRNMLMETYCSIRKDINCGKDLNFLTTEWPLLFTKEGIFDHFEKLVGVNVERTLNQSFSKLGLTIFNFFLSEPKIKISKKTSDKDSLKNYIGKVKTSLQRGEDAYTWLNLLTLLMAYFEDDMEKLFIIVEAAVTVGEVEMVIPSTPCLICCGEHMQNLTSFMLAIDSKIILNDIKTFEDGLALLFSSYFCLNIEYPASAATTLECIQRCFLDINPLKGSKTDAKKKVGVNPKIISLKKRIVDFEWNL